MRYIEHELKEIILKNYNDYREKISGRIRIDFNLTELSIDYLLFCLPLLKLNIMKNYNHSFRFPYVVFFYKNQELLFENEKKEFIDYYFNNFNINLLEIKEEELKEIENERIETIFIENYIKDNYKELESIIRTYENIKEF